MIISMSQPAEAPAKEPVAKPEPAKPRVRITRQGGGKFVIKTTSATKERKPPAARPGTKAAKVLKLLQRPDGASLGELTKATKWQPHSVRGFISGSVKRKMRLKVTTLKRDDGERAYRLASN